MLFDEGGDGCDVYLLLTGRLIVQRGELVLAELDGPDVVGEFAFIDNRPRSASVRALSEARLLRLDRETLLQQLGNDFTALNQVLQALADRMKQRLTATPPAVETTQDFLTRLTAEALGHRAVHHPYLLALADGELPDHRWALGDFGRQYLGYSAYFPRYLATVISRLDLPAHRSVLMENLAEESGHYTDEDLAELRAVGVLPEWIVGVPHPQLFERFCVAVAGASPAPDDDSMEVRCWREMLLSVLSAGSAAEAVGALGLGTETVISTMYTHFLPALDLADVQPRDAVFFPLHTTVDDHHQATLLEIAAYFSETEEGRRDLYKGMRKALYLRVAFWDWMYARAQGCPPT
jgi:pyrroloquinoline quinone (PQQ) biosynthesis protein C